MAAEPLRFSHPHVAKLMARREQITDDAERGALLNEMVDLYARLHRADQAAAEEARLAFLLLLEAAPEVLEDERFCRFLAEHVTPEDFANLKWGSPERVIALYEGLHSVQFETPSMIERVETHAGHLLRESLRKLEQRGELEAMFQLFRAAPFSSGHADAELLRLRRWAMLYELRRVQRNRRWPYGFLILQAVLILGVFPFLFINAENGAIQNEIEQAADVDLPEEQRQFFSYTDGLYWSIITAASIGYGDVTPVTSIGRAIAAVLGTMGVLTIGVVAGLILSWITPRGLP